MKIISYNLITILIKKVGVERKLVVEIGGASFDIGPYYCGMTRTT